MLPILCKDCMQIPEYTLLEKNPLKNSSHKILVQQECCHPSKLSSLLHDFPQSFVQTYQTKDSLDNKIVAQKFSSPRRISVTFV